MRPPRAVRPAPGPGPAPAGTRPAPQPDRSGHQEHDCAGRHRTARPGTHPPDGAANCLPVRSSRPRPARSAAGSARPVAGAHSTPGRARPVPPRAQGVAQGRVEAGAALEAAPERANECVRPLERRPPETRRPRSGLGRRRNCDGLSRARSSTGSIDTAVPGVVRQRLSPLHREPDTRRTVAGRPRRPPHPPASPSRPAPDCFDAGGAGRGGRTNGRHRPPGGGGSYTRRVRQRPEQ